MRIYWMLLIISIIYLGILCYSDFNVPNQALNWYFVLCLFFPDNDNDDDNNDDFLLQVSKIIWDDIKIRIP